MDLGSSPGFNANAVSSATDPRSGSAFLKLPVELLLRISWSLSTTEFGDLRLTCRRTEKALFSGFARDFFSKKQFMLTESSLRALIDISRHPTLSASLRHLIIGLDRYQAKPPLGLSSSQVDALLAGVAAQSALLWTGKAVPLLTEALRGLPNLETIGIRDFNNVQRNRDGPQAEWRSYGAAAVFAETGVPTTMLAPNNQDEWISQVFSIAFSSIVASGVRPPNIEVVLQRQKVRGLLDRAFYTPQSLQDSARLVLSGLKKLRLDIDPVTLAQWRLPISTARALEMVVKSCLADFLSHAPNITWLRLNFQDRHQQPPQPLLGWLAGGISTVGEPLFPHLAQLDLGYVQVLESTLLAVIICFAPTLRGLSLRHVTFADVTDRTHPIHPWQSFLARLGPAAELRRFSLAYPSVVTIYSGQRAYIILDVPEFAVKIKEKSVSGDLSEVRDFIAELSKNAVVEWPDDAFYDSDADEDEDEDDEDDDDDGDEDDAE